MATTKDKKAEDEVTKVAVVPDPDTQPEPLDEDAAENIRNSYAMPVEGVDQENAPREPNE